MAGMEPNAQRLAASNGVPWNRGRSHASSGFSRQSSVFTAEEETGGRPILLGCGSGGFFKTNRALPSKLWDDDDGFSLVSGLKSLMGSVIDQSDFQQFVFHF